MVDQIAAITFPLPMESNAALMPSNFVIILSD